MLEIIRFIAHHTTMTRHGKNATASSVYTYHEKKKDTGKLFVKQYNKYDT